MSVINRYKIVDKNIENAIREIEGKALEGIDGNAEVIDKKITYADIQRLKQNKPYIDQDKNLVFRIGDKLYFYALTTDSPDSDSPAVEDTTRYINCGGATDVPVRFYVDAGDAASVYSPFQWLNCGGA